MLRTICAGFKEGQAPEECDNEGFLNNKCSKDAEGYAACAANAAGDGLTGCEVTNEFPFYQCVCRRACRRRRLGGRHLVRVRVSQRVPRRHRRHAELQLRAMLVSEPRRG